MPPEMIEAIISERKTAQELAQQALPLADPGRPPKAQDNDGMIEKGVVNTFLQRGSTNADYLTARIARDRPDILERMQVGEFKSVRAAALEAGIVKKTVRVPLDAQKAARVLPHP